MRRHSTSASEEHLLCEPHIANEEARVAIPLHRIRGLLLCLWLQILSNHHQGKQSVHFSNQFTRLQD